MKANGGTLICPLDRRAVSLPTRGVTGLTLNFIIDDLIGIQELNRPDHFTACGICSVRKQVWIVMSS